MKQQGKEPTRENLHAESARMLEEGVPHSESIPWMMRNLPEIGWQKGVVIIDGIRHSKEYESMTNLFSSYVLIFCDCPEDKLVKRIMKRDGVTEKDAKIFLSNQAEEDRREYFLKKTDPSLVITPETDLKEVAEKVGIILTESNGNLIVGVSGRMGSGKSTFCNFLKEYLLQEV